MLLKETYTIVGNLSFKLGVVCLFKCMQKRSFTSRALTWYASLLWLPLSSDMCTHKVNWPTDLYRVGDCRSFSFFQDIFGPHDAIFDRK